MTDNGNPTHSSSGRADVSYQDELACALSLADWVVREMTTDGDLGKPPAAMGGGFAQTKSEPSDWVTAMDGHVERHVREMLHKQFPEAQVCGEEGGQSGSTRASAIWYVDPIDGTCNYRFGLPWHSFSLAFVEAGRPVVAVIADSSRNEIFHAVRGGGMGCNGQPCLPPVYAEDAVPLWRGGVVLSELANHRWWPGLEKIAQWCEEEFTTLRVFGSSALDLAHVAAGRAAGCALNFANPIDTAAGVLLLQEAGATVLDGDGRPVELSLPTSAIFAGWHGTAQALWNIGGARR
jgi:fructose-1,6-bisphosphatase/inositol monophosphatase family enzyme